MSENEIRFWKEGAVGFILLQRPKVLNALNFSMLCSLKEILQHYEKDDSVRCVFIEGEGRAFSSGMDVVAVYKALKNAESADRFFHTAYDLNAYIKSYSKPYIAYLDGIVMGEGAGISMHGTYRIVTENTIFSMPEGRIGFFTDAASVFFMRNLPLFMQHYLLLTGTKLAAGDCLKLGLATHAFSNKNYAQLKDILIGGEDIERALASFSVESGFDEKLSSAHYALIEECFSLSKLSEMLDFLKLRIKNGDLIASSILEQFSRIAPRSLALIFSYIHRAAILGFESIIALEKKIASHMLICPDFSEGVRAYLIDKDQNPRWNPSVLEKIDDLTDFQHLFY